jgi:hypothetical protein
MPRRARIVFPILKVRMPKRLDRRQRELLAIMRRMEGLIPFEGTGAELIRKMRLKSLRVNQ